MPTFKSPGAAAGGGDLRGPRRQGPGTCIGKRKESYPPTMEVGKPLSKKVVCQGFVRPSMLVGRVSTVSRFPEFGHPRPLEFASLDGFLRKAPAPPLAPFLNTCQLRSFSFLCVKPLRTGLQKVTERHLNHLNHLNSSKRAHKRRQQAPPHPPALPRHRMLALRPFFALGTSVPLLGFGTHELSGRLGGKRRSGVQGIC